MFSRPDWKPWETVKNWRMKILFSAIHEEDAADAREPSPIGEHPGLQSQLDDADVKEPFEFET